MPIHALLGATGGTGSAVLRYLLECPPEKEIQLNIFVRSEGKLLSLFPDLLREKSINVKIYTGSLKDESTLAECLQDAEIIYNCIATNDAGPKVDTAQCAARAILAALQRLQNAQGKDYNPPLLLINRSQTLNPVLTFAGFLGEYLRSIIHFTLRSVYDDIEKACEMYTSSPPSLLRYVLIDGPGLQDSEGTVRTGYEFVREGMLSATINYADFGAAFVEVGARRGEFEGGAVGVSATGHVREQVWPFIRNQLRGLRGRYLGW